MGLEYDENGQLIWKIKGKKVPTSKEVGAAAVDAARRTGKELGAVGGVLGEFARDQFSTSKSKLKTLNEKMLEKAKGSPSSMKKGGKVKKTGYIKLHKGEKVIPAKKKKIVKRKKRR